MIEINIVGLIILIGAFIFFVGMLIGIFLNEKINKLYYLNAIDAIERFLKEHNRIHTDWRIEQQKANDDWYRNNANLHKEYLDTIIKDVLESHRILKEWMEKN